VVSRGQTAVLLAGLLMPANRAVPESSMTEWLSDGEAMPAHFRPLLHNLVSRLRRCLGADQIQTLPWGYRLNADADELDLLRCVQLTTSAEQADADGQRERALILLDEAIALWQEPPWDNVSAPGLRDRAVPPDRTVPGDCRAAR
jgi:Bacterial transcriptional activator domain